MYPKRVVAKALLNSVCNPCAKTGHRPHRCMGPCRSRYEATSRIEFLFYCTMYVTIGLSHHKRKQHQLTIIRRKKKQSDQSEEEYIGKNTKIIKDFPIFSFFYNFSAAVHSQWSSGQNSYASLL